MPLAMNALLYVQCSMPTKKIKLQTPLSDLIDCSSQSDIRTFSISYDAVTRDLTTSPNRASTGGSAYAGARSKIASIRDLPLPPCIESSSLAAAVVVVDFPVTIEPNIRCRPAWRCSATSAEMATDCAPSLPGAAAAVLMSRLTLASASRTT